MTLDFATVDVPDDIDSIPPVNNIEYPCEKCGREAGPYRGRGRKPKVCADCKPKRSSTPRVTGTNANLAAQASEVLSQINAMAALGAGALRMLNTAGAIAAYDETFKSQAYAALTTDPELCRFILKGGVKSAKITLLLAYGGMALAVAPHAMEEIKTIQAGRKARKNEEGVES